MQVSLVGRGFKAGGSVFVHVTPAVDRKELQLFTISASIPVLPGALMFQRELYPEAICHSLWSLVILLTLFL